MGIIKYISYPSKDGKIKYQRIRYLPTRDDRLLHMKKKWIGVIL